MHSSSNERAGATYARRPGSTATASGSRPMTCAWRALTRTSISTSLYSAARTIATALSISERSASAGNPQKPTPGMSSLSAAPFKMSQRIGRAVQAGCRYFSFSVMPRIALRKRSGPSCSKAGIPASPTCSKVGRLKPRDKLFGKKKRSRLRSAKGARFNEIFARSGRRC